MRRFPAGGLVTALAWAAVACAQTASPADQAPITLSLPVVLDVPSFAPGAPPAPPPEPSVPATSAPVVEFGRPIRIARGQDDFPDPLVSSEIPRVSGSGSGSNPVQTTGYAPPGTPGGGYVTPPLPGGGEPFNPPASSAAEEAYNRGVVTGNSPTKGKPTSKSGGIANWLGFGSADTGASAPGGGHWYDPIVPVFVDADRQWFQSDHCFDEFISPVTNPFYFEDPRSLTEIRPIFMLQTIPNSQWLYQGGQIYTIGTQARLAITDRLSVTLNKLGGIWINPGDGSPLKEAGGFEEIWIGPKFTFLRLDSSRTVAAGGVLFEIPTGPNKVYQGTSNMSVTPYVSVAQNFWKTSWGSMNVMDTFSYSFGTGQRSTFLYNSLHLDYDVANLHKFYPLVELHWFHYTSSGSAVPTDFEMRDLGNVGASMVNGRNYISIAPGARYKFSEMFQVGTGFDFPLNGTRDLMNFRWTVDFIFRY